MAKKATGLRPYRSYRFISKDPVIDLTRTVVQDSGYNYHQISDASGVSVSTLYNWFHGGTKRPQFCTVNAVGRACGQELVWQPMQLSRRRDNR